MPFFSFLINCMLGVGPVFPSGLLSYGLNEDLLAEVFHQVQNDKSPSWCLRGIPDYGFYQDLHQYLKKWPHTRDSSKVSIGKFYSVIDLNLRQKALQPDNAYRFVDRLASSNTPFTLHCRTVLELVYLGLYRQCEHN